MRLPGESMNAEPKPFDVVHPSLKKQCSIVVSGDLMNLFQCIYCRGRFVYRNNLVRYCDEGIFCSWDCVIDYADYVNWRFEMERKGYHVDLKVWSATEKGTRYFEKLAEASRNMEKQNDVD